MLQQEPGKDPGMLPGGTGVTQHGESSSPPVVLLLPDTHIVTVPRKVKNLLFKNSKLFKEPSTCLSGWEISVIITTWCSQGLRPQMTCLCPERVFADSL